MATEGITGLLFETHNWGKAVAFWQELGYELEFETDHHSGQLRHPAGGAWIFLAERPLSQPVQFYPVVTADDSTTFEAPKSCTVESKFVAQHWQVMEQMLLDPDGRRLSIQTPLPPNVTAPAGHQ